MNAEELSRYKNMSAEEIDRKIVPDIEDIKDKKMQSRFPCTL